MFKLCTTSTPKNNFNCFPLTCLFWSDTHTLQTNHSLSYLTSTLHKISLSTNELQEKYFILRNKQEERLKDQRNYGQKRLVFLVFSMPFCQAQPKLQVKLSLKAELALFPLDPATHPPGKVSSPAILNQN